MQYMCLIYGDENGRATASEDDRAQMMAAYGAFTESIRESGHMVGGDALHPASTATTVRVRDGETLVTDGPFAETKEQLGGYYLIEAKDADEAIAIAARIPGAQYGSIEVRPVFSAADYEG
jgi:hypothetical protein